MKHKLLELYMTRKQDFLKVRDQFLDEDMAGPFLMSPNETYNKQENPLLIIGQETKGWHYYDNDYEKQMLEYENFNVGIDYFSSPFWNVIRKTEKAIGNEPYSSAWSNVSKFDLNEGRSFGEAEIAISSLDDILLHEIGIVQPKVCIFFTGPDFDWRIRKIFKGIKFLEIENHELRAFSQLKHLDLPEMSFRSYHPNYLRRSGTEKDFLKFVEDKFKTIRKE